MVRLAFGFGPTREEAGPLRLDLREVRRAEAAPQNPTYSFDTLQEIRRELPHPAFVIGSDQLENLPRWHRFPEILGLCHWIVLARRPHGEDQAGAAARSLESSGLLRATSQPGTWAVSSQRFLTLVPTDAREVSSTAVRETIGRTGIPPEKDLTPEVGQYLKERRLYGSVAPKPHE